MTDQQAGWIRDLIEPLRVKPGSHVDLSRDFDPSARFGVRKKVDGQDLLRQGVELLADIWKRRYREINDWEHYLAGNGIRVVKMFLNVSKEEQRRRFLRRIDQPEKNWKFSASDVRERRYWDDYQRAYSETLSHTSTECAS